MPSKRILRPAPERQIAHSLAHKVFWLGALLLVFFLPLVFSTALYRSFETAKSSLLRIGVAALLMVWSLLFYRKRTVYLLPFSPLTWALVLNVLAFSCSSLLSIEPTLSIFGTYDRQVGLIGVVAGSLFYFFLTQAFALGNQKRFVVRTLVLSGFIISVYSLVQWLNLDPLEWSKAFGNRPSSTVGHPDFLGSLLVMIIPLSLSLGYTEANCGWRMLWLLASLAQLGGVVVSQTRGAWIAAFISLVTFFLAEPFLFRKNTSLMRKKITVSLVALAFMVGSGAVILALNSEYRSRASSILKMKEQARIYLWRDSFNVIKAYPVLGSGPETFRLSFLPYKSLELTKREPTVNFDNPHNNYLYLWATTGTVGLVTYLALLFCAFRQGTRKLKGSADSSVSTHYLGVLVSLQAYGVAMVSGFDTLTTIFTLYVLLALIGTRDPQESAPLTSSPPVGRGGSSLRASVIVGSFILFTCTLIDSARVTMADSFALKAIKGLRQPIADPMEARDNLVRAISLLPRESFYRLQLGMANLSLWQKDQTDKTYIKEALKWGSSSLAHGWAPENSYNLMGTAYLYTGDCDHAEVASRKGLEIDHYNFPLRTNLALSLACQGRKPEALSEVGKALEVNPEYPLAKSLREWLRR